MASEKQGEAIPRIWNLFTGVFFFVVGTLFTVITLGGWGPTILKMIQDHGLKPTLGVLGIFLAFLVFFTVIGLTSFFALLPWIRFTFGGRRTTSGEIVSQFQKTIEAGSEGVTTEDRLIYAYTVAGHGAFPVVFKTEEVVTLWEYEKIVPGLIEVEYSVRFPHYSRRIRRKYDPRTSRLPN